MDKYRNDPADPDRDEAGLEDLLREVGAREEPPADVMREVRAAVHAQWQDMAAQRQRRRRGVIFASAAAAAAVAVVTTLNVIRFETAPAQRVASAARIQGEVTRRPGEGDRPQVIAEEDALYAGDEISTAQGARAALDLGKGLSVRVDSGSSVRLVSPERLIIEHGAVYVDANPAVSASTNFVVQTDAGTVQHVGTQYEVRTVSGEVQVSVREGRVAIDYRGASHVGEAGEQLVLKDNGEVVRQVVPIDDPRWQWVMRIAPAFDIENEPLSAFLAWVARETGREVAYASPEAQRAAEDIILRGSIARLHPDAALSAVLATTELELNHSGSQRIEIGMRD